MKKVSWISLLLALAIGIVLFACSSDDPSPGGTSSNSGDAGDYSSGSDNPGGDSSGSNNKPSSSSTSASSPATSSSSSKPASSSSVPSTPSCAYQPSWCNNVTVSTTPTTSGNTCFFVSDVSAMQGVGIKVNGETPATNNNSEFVCGMWDKGTCASLLPAKKDGGYYIFIGQWISNTNFANGSPNCNGSVNPGVSSSSKPSSSSSAGNGGTSSNSGGGGTANTGTPVNGGKNGSGWASRYWDGCKPSCGWSDNAGGNPTKSCGNDGITKLDNDAKNKCMDGGDAHTCYSQAPWKVTDQVAYGFAASHTNGDCGKCFRLTFKGTTQHAANSNALNHIKGKIMVVKISNIGGDVGGNQFDLMIPGGGLGAFDGFTMQTGVNGSVLSSSERYGGFVTDCGGGNEGNGALSTLQTCVKNKCTSAFTNTDLKAGCDFYADWAGAANNPQFDFVEVTCPSELNSKW